MDGSPGIRSAPHAVETAEAQRPWIRDQQSEHTKPRRPSADETFLVRVEPTGKELGQLGPVLVQHSEGAVPGVGQGAGLVDDVPEQGPQLEVRLEEEDGIEDSSGLPGPRRSIRHAANVSTALAEHRRTVTMATGAMGAAD